MAGDHQKANLAAGPINRLDHPRSGPTVAVEERANIDQRDRALNPVGFHLTAEIIGWFPIDINDQLRRGRKLRYFAPRAQKVKPQRRAAGAGKTPREDE